jgi:CRP-like cAMP-binding protein
MKVFLDYILPFGDLDKSQLDFILSKAVMRELHKDEYFSEAGKVPQEVGFVLEGIFRFCYYNSKGEEITNYFIDKNTFVTDYMKFEDKAIATEYVQAVTDCKMLVFSRKDWEEISNSIGGWDKIAIKIYRKCLNEAIERRSPLVSEDATTRYLSFINKFPTIAYRVPLSYVASYLGITQQSLSRIRRNIL